MISVNAEKYAGRSLKAALKEETARKEYGDLFGQPYFVTVNGVQMSADDDQYIIRGEDNIDLFPLYSGG